MSVSVRLSVCKQDGNVFHVRTISGRLLEQFGVRLANSSCEERGDNIFVYLISLINTDMKVPIPNSFNLVHTRDVGHLVLKFQLHNFSL